MLLNCIPLNNDGLSQSVLSAFGAAVFFCAYNAIHKMLKQTAGKARRKNLMANVLICQKDSENNEKDR